MTQEELKKLRMEVDSIDAEIISLIPKRLEKVREISKIKKDDKKELTDADREREIFDSIEKSCKELGLDKALVIDIFKRLINGFKGLMINENKDDNWKIPFGEWEKFEFRVAKIIDVKEHPNADKLYLIGIDLGNEKRTLVAGLKQYYSPDELKGKLCIVFTNLEPVTIRGIKSEGMILAADSGEGIAIITPEKEVKLGSKIR